MNSDNNSQGNNLYKKLKIIIHWWSGINRNLLYCTLTLISIGLIFSTSTTSAISARVGIENGLHFFMRHLIFSFMAFCLILLFSTFSKDVIVKISKIAFAICLMLLFYILLNGSEIKGSKRWINIYFITLQPSELLKPFFIVINSILISHKEHRYFYFSFSFLLFFLIATLLILEPDFGSTLIYLSIWLIQIFLGGLHRKIIVYLMPLPVVISIIGFIFFPHFNKRITTFLNKSHASHNYKNNYQINKSVSGIISGGFYGKGLYEGEIKYQLPDVHTDYVISAIAEEMGIIFVVFILILYLLLCYYAIVFHKEHNKHYTLNEQIIMLSILFLITAEVFINTCVAFNILPSKGMVLPFISYGGSAMIANSILIGILLAITNKNRVS